jgi:hypothetical protein
MEREAKAFTDINSQMSKYGTHTLTREFYQWQTPALILMDLNSSFVLMKLLILMKSIQFLEESFQDMILLKK